MCSFIVFGIVIGLLVIFSKDMFEKSNPNVVVSESFDLIPDMMDFSSDNEVVAFGLTNYFTWIPIVDPTVF
jgi:hypothetical protein